MTFTFEVTILGGSGGPIENDCQSFLIRPYGSDVVDSICVDAGTGLGSLYNLVAQIGTSDEAKVNDYYNQNVTTRKVFNDVNVAYTNGFSSSLKKVLSEKYQNLNHWETTILLYNGIRDYYITHPHLDHIAGLIINSPLAYEISFGTSKNVYGLTSTKEALTDHIFNDTIWPSLNKLKYPKINLNALKQCRTHDIANFPWTTTPFKVNHGCGACNGEPNHSTIYCIRHNKTSEAIVVCGDLENKASIDTLDSYLQTFTNWLTNNILAENFKGILIECSSQTVPDGTPLFGHLSPPHLISLLNLLLKKYNDIGQTISELNVIVTHVKYTCGNEDPRLTVLSELRNLAKFNNLHNLNFSYASQGTTYYL